MFSSIWRPLVAYPSAAHEELEAAINTSREKKKLERPVQDFLHLFRVSYKRERERLSRFNTSGGDALHLNPRESGLNFASPSSSSSRGRAARGHEERRLLRGERRRRRRPGDRGAAEGGAVVRGGAVPDAGQEEALLLVLQEDQAASPR